MTVHEFLKIVTKDNEANEYDQEVTIQTDMGKILAQGKVSEVIKIDDVENWVKNLQGFQIVEMIRIPKNSKLNGQPLPKYNCPYLLTVV